MLSKVKILLGITDTSKDDLLNLLIELAEDECLKVTHMSEYDDTLDNTVVKMVIYKYNRMGTEGASSESYSGVSYSYTSDYPEEIMRDLRMLRKVTFL